MSFSFGFSGDDIEDEGESDDFAQQVEDLSVHDRSVSLVQPQVHTLREMLSSLPSQISYNILPIPKQHSRGAAAVAAAAAAEPQRSDSEIMTSEIAVPRRSVFDIRTQLMAEAHPEENDNDELLAGLERGDLTSGIYEGGFKTWECATDLASLVAGLALEKPVHIIELGAGSAIPSSVALYTALQREPHRPIYITLCDYNQDVLKLATAPNMFLAQRLYEQASEIQPNLAEQDVEDIDQAMIDRCVRRLEKSDVSFAFLSGPWGADFVRLVQSAHHLASDQSPDMLILASETIYSPKSTHTFAETVVQLLRCGTHSSKAWIAAKKVYFGVGGSVDEFIQAISLRGGLVSTVLDVADAGVGRVILEVVVRT